MEVLVSSHAGLCFGVRRATRLAMEVRKNHPGPVYTLGPLMHNPQEVERLAGLGIVQRQSIDQCVGGKTLLRTHGIPRRQLQLATRLGIDLVDAVCPRVAVVRRYIVDFGRRGYQVVLVGDRGHPEVEALQSYAPGEVIVASLPGDLERVAGDRPLVVLAQTTQAREVFDAVVSACRRRVPQAESICTICQDAGLRQVEGRQLAARADLMLVVGGRISANTARLAEICRRVQPRTHHIETAAELETIDFTGVKTVGLTSGASTPTWIIEQVRQRLSLFR